MLILSVKGLIKPQSQRCNSLSGKRHGDNIISVIVRRKNEYKGAGKTASSEGEKREDARKPAESGDRKGKEHAPIRPKNKEGRMLERERVAEVVDRSRKDTKTEKNGETPREKDKGDQEEEGDAREKHVVEQDRRTNKRATHRRDREGEVE